LVNREFVREHLTPGPVAGRRFTGGPAKAAAFEIVGVVDDMLKDGLDTQPMPEIYSISGAGRPIDGQGNGAMRMAGSPSEGASILRRAVLEIDRGAAVGDLMPLAARLSSSAAQPRFAVAVLGAFAAVALVLSSVGVYGVLSYTVARRRRELAIRA